MAEKVTVAALDLSYLRTGFAVVEQPGDKAHHWGVIRATPVTPRGRVTEQIRIMRAKNAFDEMRLSLYHADTDFGLDALVYEKPQLIGARMRQRGTSRDAVLALGMAMERMYIVLALTKWLDKDEMRPVYAIDPTRWQPLFTGVTARQLGKGKMKELGWD